MWKRYIWETVLFTATAQRWVSRAYGEGFLSRHYSRVPLPVGLVPSSPDVGVVTHTAFLYRPRNPHLVREASPRSYSIQGSLVA